MTTTACRRFDPATVLVLGALLAAWIGGALKFMVLPAYVELGGDEGMEMAKAVLLARARGEAAFAWNDQPWLYSEILARLYGWTGGWEAGRLLSVLLGGLWLVAVVRLLPAGSGWLHALCAGLMLLTWPGFIHLGASMMLELPVCALAATALVPLTRGGKCRLVQVAAAGVLAGVATGLKLVALVALPAWVVALALAGRRNVAEAGPVTLRRWGGAFGMTATVWSLAFAITTGVLLHVGPSGPDQSLLVSHVDSARFLRETGDRQLVFTPGRLLASAGTSVAATIGLVLLLRRRRWLEAAVPVALVVTPLCVHLWHRPFWDYYLLHFATGAAVLGGWGAGELIRCVGAYLPGAAAAAVRRFEQALMGAAAVVALWLAVDLDRALEEARGVIRQAHLSSQTLLIPALVKAAPDLRFVFTPSAYSAYPATLGLVMVPELTLTPRKRFWAGLLTPERLLEIIERRQPDALLLRADEDQRLPGWQPLLSSGYTHVLTDQGLALYLRKELSAEPAVGMKDFLRSRGW